MNVGRRTSSAAGLVIGLMVALGPWATTGAAAGAEAGPLPVEDARALKAGFKAIDDGKPKQARSAEAGIKDPVAAKLLRWARLVAPDPNASFDEIAGFMADNPAWPDQRGLQRRAEEAMTPTMPDDKVLAWFGDRAPVSGDGQARLGAALLATGDVHKGEEVLKRAWINGDFTKHRERAFYKRHRRLLTLEDHRRRLDRLLWEGRYWPARRILWKVKPDYRALSVARLALRFDRGHVDRLIAKVPDKLKSHPGLVYERLRWRRRKGKDASARELLENPPPDLVHPRRWWKERVVLARRALYKGHVTAAYGLARDHGLDGGAAFAEAEWLAGWIALRFLRDPTAAKRHFMAMYAAVNYPVSRARGAYWTARAMEPAGETDMAESWYGLAAQFPTTYYGQLAITRIRPGANLELIEGPAPSHEEIKAFEALEPVRAVRILGEIGEHDRLRPFILGLDEMAESPGWRLLTAELARANERPDLAVLIAKRAHREGWRFPHVAFPEMIPSPMDIKGASAAVEGPLILAVVRQESAFNVKAKSHA
ncbi:MAG: lytic transglycosylase domain-containing protein, partial [Rhodospirillales bacterium]